MLYLRWLAIRIVARSVGLGDWMPPYALVEAGERFGSNGINWSLLTTALVLIGKRRSMIEVDRRPHVLN